MKNKMIFIVIIAIIIGFICVGSVSAYKYQYITEEQKETILQNSDNSQDTEKANQLANINIDALMEALVVLKYDYENKYETQEESMQYSSRISKRYSNYQSVFKTYCENDAIKLGDQDPRLLVEKIDSLTSKINYMQQSIAGAPKEQVKKDEFVITLLQEKLNIYKNIYQNNGYQEEYKEIQNANILDFGIWKPTIYSDDDGIIKSKAGIIIGAINVIGIVVSVITLSIIGIRYMVGSVEERAEYKQIMFPWLIGAVMVFAMTTIPNIIYNFF